MRVKTSSLAKYKNKWVAIDTEKDSIITFNNSLANLEKKLGSYEKDDPRIMVMKVPPIDKAYAPTIIELEPLG